MKARHRNICTDPIQDPTAAFFFRELTHLSVSCSYLFYLYFTKKHDLKILIQNSQLIIPRSKMVTSPSNVLPVQIIAIERIHKVKKRLRVSTQKCIVAELILLKKYASLTDYFGIMSIRGLHIWVHNCTIHLIQLCFICL